MKQKSRERARERERPFCDRGDWESLLKERLNRAAGVGDGNRGVERSGKSRHVVGSFCNLISAASPPIEVEPFPPGRRPPSLLFLFSLQLTWTNGSFEKRQQQENRPRLHFLTASEIYLILKLLDNVGRATPTKSGFVFFL